MVTDVAIRNGRLCASMRLAWLFAWLLLPQLTRAAMDTSIPLFSLERATSMQDMRRRAAHPALDELVKATTTASVRLVWADASVLSDRTDDLRIDLDETHAAIFHKARFDVLADDMSVWLGEIEQGKRTRGGMDSEVPMDEMNSAMLLKHGDRIFGTMRVNGQLYTIEPLSHGEHAVIKVDESPEDVNDTIPVPPKAYEEPDAALPKQSARSADTIIRVLIAVTKQSESGLVTPEESAALDIEAANQTFINSYIHVRFENAGVLRTNYSEIPADEGVDLLKKLKDPGNTSLGAPVAAMREQKRAQLVVLYANPPGLCGLAYMKATKDFAFSLVKRTPNCVLTFSHETGHNFGARHDPANNTSTQGFPFGHGYQQKASPAWSTVMAYATCPGGCPRIGYWSNPQRTYNGLPMGMVDLSDSAKALNGYRYTVAAFYPDPASDPPVAAAIARPASVDGEQLVTLDGSGSSDPSGGSLRYRWVQSGGSPAVSITDSTSAIATAAIPAVAESSSFQFRLTVINSDDLDDSKDVTVTATPSIMPPAVVINGQDTAQSGEAVTLDASASMSNNPGATPLQFDWRVPPGIMDAQTNGAFVRFTAPTVNSATPFRFEVTVSDGKASAGGVHGITVRPAASPGPEARISGPDTVESGKVLNLSGAGSFGSSLSYAWSAPDFALSHPNAANVALTAPNTAGRRTIALTVRDPQNRSNTATHTINVTAGSGGDTCPPHDPAASSKPAWNASTAYVAGNEVQYNGVVWRASWHTSGRSPDKSDAFELLSKLPVPWDTARPYVGGTEVIYEGKVYRAQYWIGAGSRPGVAGVWTFQREHACP